MAYTDQLVVERYLKRELSDDEGDTLNLLIPAVEAWIDSYTDSTFRKKTDPETRYYEGEAGVVNIEPVQNVTAVKLLDNSGDVDTEYVLNDDYTLEPSNSVVKNQVVRRYGEYWPGERRIAVTGVFTEYDSEVPPEIQIAATRLVGQILRGGFNDAQSGGLKKESLEGHSVEYATSSDDIDKIFENDPVIKRFLGMHKEILLG